MMPSIIAHSGRCAARRRCGEARVVARDPPERSRAVAGARGGAAPHVRGCCSRAGPATLPGRGAAPVASRTTRQRPRERRRGRPQARRRAVGESRPAGSRLGSLAGDEAASRGTAAAAERQRSGSGAAAERQRPQPRGRAGAGRWQLGTRTREKAAGRPRGGVKRRLLSFPQRRGNAGGLAPQGRRAAGSCQSVSSGGAPSLGSEAAGQRRRGRGARARGAPRSTPR